MIRPDVFMFVLVALLFGAPAASAQGVVGSIGDAVSWTSSDGVEASGTIFAPKDGKPVLGAIVFVHEPNRSGRDWTYMAEKMASHGFWSLTFDLRGHGGSLVQNGEELDRELFGPEDFGGMTADVGAAVEHARSLAGVENDRVHLAGSDLGGSLAVMYGGDDSAVRSVAMLSPGLGYDGVNAVGSVAEFGKRNVLLVYSMEDTYSRKSTEVFEREARGGVHVEAYYGVGHGMKMLAREPRLETLLTSWFLGTVLTDEGRTLAETGKPLAQDKDVEIEIDAEAEKERLKKQKKEADESKGEAVGEEEEPKRLEVVDD